MLNPHFFVGVFAFGLMALGTGTVSGQTYPSKHIRLLAGTAGGGSDFTGRVIATALTTSLGQQVIVVNRGGAGFGPGEVAANAQPDGYTLLIEVNSFWIEPLLQKAPYDVIRDFSPISLVTSAPYVLVVPPSSPVNSVKDLIALAKARPGELNYASGGLGGAGHIATELFKSMAGVNIVHVAYKGSGPAVIDLIGGRVQMMIATAASVVPHLKSGKLRAVAVTSAAPTALLPGLQSMAASGLPGYEASGLTCMFAPARTTVAIINRLNQEIVRAINQSEVKERLFNNGVDVVGSSPEELAATIKSETAKMSKVIKDAGIRAE